MSGESLCSSASNTCEKTGAGSESISSTASWRRPSRRAEVGKKVAAALPSKYPVAEELLKALDPDHCGAEYKHGGFIKSGYNKELDTCRSAKSEGKEWLASLEQTEKEATGIKTLHIGYNKVFGYYIEVSKGNLSLVPFRYQRKQTLVNGERFITEELKAMEERLLP